MKAIRIEYRIGNKLQSSKETRVLNGICIALIILSGIFRLISQKYSICANLLIYIWFTAAGIIWIYQIRRRILQNEVRKYLTIAAILMIFLMADRTIKYEFTNNMYTFSRYAWYLYYVPQICCPLFMFFAVLHIGRPYDRPINRRWKLLYIPAVILVMGILTNDFHQLAFVFHNGPTMISDNQYGYGPVYYAVIIWMFGMIGSMLAIVFWKCSVSENRKKIWMPILPLLLGITYMIIFFLNHDNIWIFMFKVPEMICFVFTAFMECLILVHLLPSNDSYGDFWNASSIGVGIMDYHGDILYRSKQSISVTSDQIIEAEKREILLENGRIALKSKNMHGGFCYWTRDLSEIFRLNQEIYNLGDVLTEENAILTAENKLKEDRVRIRKKNELYDSLAVCVQSQIDKLNELIKSLTDEESAFEQAMKYACILNSYIKRYSNLLLLYHQKGQIDSSELCLAISESIEYVRQYGVKAYAAYAVEGILPGETILLVYEVFETVLEAGIPGADAVFVKLDRKEQTISFYMELNLPGKFVQEDMMREKIYACKGTIKIEKSNHTEYVHLELPTGGKGK